MADDEPDGIQLRGKQLVFQAMSAIVVAVGIFLLGVMVGRGVPTARQPGTVVAQDTIREDAIREDADPLVPSPAVPPEEALPIAQDDSGANPGPGYQDELFSDSAPNAERIKPTSKPEPFAAETAVATAPALERRAPVSPVAPAERKRTEGEGAGKEVTVEQVVQAASGKAAPAEQPARSANGFMVQVAAYQRQGDATSVRNRLTSKGYPAFVTSASTTAGTFYRVRVGGYDREGEARSVAARLKREEHLEPWVTR